MKKYHLLVFLFAALCAFPAVWAHAGDDADTPPAPKPVKISKVRYMVSVLDRVMIKTSGKIQSYQVDQDGNLDMGDGPFKASGITPAELRSRVMKHAGNADSVTIEEFRPNRVSVLGEIAHPVFTELSEGPMRVLDAIAAASGFTPVANTRRVKIVRENAGDVEVYELDLRAVLKGDKPNENILLKPGDVVTVPRNFL